MHILKAYKYLFYRNYQFQLKMSGKNNNPKWVATLTNALFVYFNLLTTLLVYQIISGHKVYIGKVFAIAIALVFVLVNYFIFFYNDRFNRIADEFADENEILRKRRTIWCWIYIIMTHVLFFGAAKFLYRD